MSTIHIYICMDTSACMARLVTSRNTQKFAWTACRVWRSCLTHKRAFVGAAVMLLLLFSLASACFDCVLEWTPGDLFETLKRYGTLYKWPYM